VPHPKGVPNGKCRVCGHPERVRLELLLAGGASLNAVAKKFTLSRHAVGRHWHTHVSSERKAALVLGPVQRAALAARLDEENASVVDSFRAVRAGLWAVYDSAITAGDGAVAALIAGKLHENLTAIARITGQLAGAASTITNNTLIMASPIMADLEQMLLERLRPFPDAAQAVFEGLEQLRAARLGQQLPQRHALDHSNATDPSAETLLEERAA